MGEVALAGGSLNDDDTTHLGFDDQDGLFDGFASGIDGSADGQVARFDYTFSTFTFSLSMEQGDNGAGDVDNIYGAGVSYDTVMAGINLGLGLGYQAQNDFADSVGFSVIGGMSNGFSAGISYASTNFDDNAQRGATNAVAATPATVDLVTGAIIPGTAAIAAEFAIGDETQKNFGIGFGYEMNAFAVGLNYGKVTNANGVDGFDVEGVGLAAAYDLGGGLQAQFGYGHSYSDDFDNVNSYSAGLSMSF
ncbi:MAG: porin [Rhodobacterales bacterium]